MMNRRQMMQHTLAGLGGLVGWAAGYLPPWSGGPRGERGLTMPADMGDSPCFRLFSLVSEGRVPDYREGPLFNHVAVGTAGQFLCDARDYVERAFKLMGFDGCNDDSDLQLSSATDLLGQFCQKVPS